MNLTIIAHNIRSTHNVGAILRTADGFGISNIYFSGYTPYPLQTHDTRLPHIRNKITAQIHKTSLGAEESVANEYHEDIAKLLQQLKAKGYRIVGLEQDARAKPLPTYKIPNEPIALLIGEEVHGIEPDLRAMCDDLIEIPMSGKKESFNVSVATGIALYALTAA